MYLENELLSNHSLISTHLWWAFSFLFFVQFLSNDSLTIPSLSLQSKHQKLWSEVPQDLFIWDKYLFLDDSSNNRK